MSKGNLFLGFGRGAVGDVVFSRLDGEQVARARNRSPRNPRSALQLLQRVVMKTCSTAYSLMQDICNHSFQGMAEGTMSQARFNKLNIGQFRELLSVEINSGDDTVIFESLSTNFSAKSSQLVEINPYIISEGTIAKLPIVFMNSAPIPAFGINVALPSATPTYEEVVQAYNLQHGDQLTFVGLSVDDTVDVGTFNGFDYARVIMEPSDAYYENIFLSSDKINNPNEKNRGDFRFTIQQVNEQYFLTFVSAKHSNVAGSVNTACAGSVIVSRFAGSVWQRSPQSLVIRPNALTTVGHLVKNHFIDYLGDAIFSYLVENSSNLYLNQAGQYVVPADGPSTPHLTGVRINTVQPPRGAVVNATSPVSVYAQLGNPVSGSSYILQVMSDNAGQPGSIVQSANFVNNEATISPVAYEAGTYWVCLRRGGSLADTYCSFIVS